MTDARYIVDTNILVSSIAFSNSIPAQALSKALTSGVLIFSEATIAEFKEVLFRPKFDRYISKSLRQKFIFEIITSAIVVDPHPCETLCRDPKDQKFLELINHGIPNAIITGDQDLLVLSKVDNCPIMTPTNFLHL